MARKLGVVGLAVPLVAIIAALVYLFLFGESEPTFADAAQRLASEHTVYGLSLDEQPAALVAPWGADPSEPLPLVVALHAEGSHVWEHASETGLIGRINEDRFILLLPNATRDADGERRWDAEHAPDVERTRLLVEEAARFVSFDRVYLVGSGSGAGLARRLACVELQDVAAAALIDPEPSGEDSICDGPDAPPLRTIDLGVEEAPQDPDELGRSIVDWLVGQGSAP